MTAVDTPDEIGRLVLADSAPGDIVRAIWRAVERREPVTIFGVKYVPAEDAR